MKISDKPDIFYMSEALKIAEKVKGKTFPNPAVGAVIVKDGVIVGSGATAAYGGPHAEIKAIKKAGDSAKNATIYVTLEPCNHYGKTPPCTQSIINARIKRVVIAIKDPNPLVNGKGIRFLKTNGLSVSVGLLKESAQKLNEDFFWSIQHKTPWITVKLAMTIDGRIADSFGNSKWITNKKARIFVHDLRKKHAAIAVGRNTIEKDNPHLTVRHVSGKSPVRIAFASKNSLDHNSFFRKDAHAIRSIIVCKGGDAGKKEVAFDGVWLWHTGKQRNSAHLNYFLKMAYEERLSSIMVEGGQKLATSFIENRLVNRLYIFYGNKFVGNGIKGISFNNGLPIEDGMFLTKFETGIFDDTIMITGIPAWEK